jgi:hypothetical protein
MKTDYNRVGIYAVFKRDVFVLFFAGRFGRIFSDAYAPRFREVS